MNTHTPGPWRVRLGELGGYYIQAPNGGPVTPDSDYHSVAECEANACLIAAAPELLEACRMACLVMAKGNGLSYADRREAHEAVIAAIRKVEGAA